MFIGVMCAVSNKVCKSDVRYELIKSSGLQLGQVDVTRFRKFVDFV